MSTARCSRAHAHTNRESDGYCIHKTFLRSNQTKNPRRAGEGNQEIPPLAEDMMAVGKRKVSLP